MPSPGERPPRGEAVDPGAGHPAYKIACRELEALPGRVRADACAHVDGQPSYVQVWLQGDILGVEQSEALPAHGAGAGDDGYEPPPPDIPALLDDGTGVAKIQLGQFYQRQQAMGVVELPLDRGKYVEVLGTVDLGSLEIVVNCIKDLSGQPDRFAMWMCELIDRDHVPFEVGRPG